MFFPRSSTEEYMLQTEVSRPATHIQLSAIEIQSEIKCAGYS